MSSLSRRSYLLGPSCLKREVFRERFGSFAGRMGLSHYSSIFHLRVFGGREAKDGELKSLLTFGGYLKGESK